MAIEFRAPTRVLFVLGALNGGGAERVALSLAEHCDASAVEIRLGLLKCEGEFLNDAAHVQRVGGSGSFWTAPWRIAAMVRESQADIVMSFGMGVNLLTWVAARLLGSRAPVWICRDDSDIGAEIRNLGLPRTVSSLVRLGVEIAYRSAECLLCVSADIADRLHHQFRVKRERLTYIYNPVHTQRIKMLARAERPPTARRYVLAAGRLTRQKGFDVLLRAFAQCPDAVDHDLVILGEGPLRQSLVDLAGELGIERRVHFPGFQSNPWVWMAQADLFVLSSRWEGFGNVVAEAMVCGVAVVAADCDFGPREQIRPDVDGLLAAPDDPDSLAGAMGDLLRDPGRRRRLASAALDRVHRLDIRDVARRYEILFHALRAADALPSGQVLQLELAEPAAALAAE
jgi:glycosyltransferase involved in cell wall biosynthesis